MSKIRCRRCWRDCLPSNKNFRPQRCAEHQCSFRVVLYNYRLIEKYWAPPSPSHSSLPLPPPSLPPLPFLSHKTPTALQASPNLQLTRGLGVEVRLDAGGGKGKGVFATQVREKDEPALACYFPAEAPPKPCSRPHGHSWLCLCSCRTFLQGMWCFRTPRWRPSSILRTAAVGPPRPVQLFHAGMLCGLCGP